MYPVKRGFTLVEMIVVILIAGMMLVGMTGMIVTAQRSWNKQTNDAHLLYNLRWALENITNDLRAGDAASVNANYLPNGNGISFNGARGLVWYWRSPQALGNNTIYHAMGTNANSFMLTQFIAVNNPGGQPMFSFNGSNNVATLCVTIQTRATSSSSSFTPGNYTLQTQVRVRN